MRWRGGIQELPLDEFLDAVSVADERARWSRVRRIFNALDALVTFAVIVTLVPVIVTVPVGLAMGTAAQTIQRAWEAIPVEVPQVPSTLPGFTRLYDTDGNVFAQFYVENRVPVTLADVSPYLVQAIVAVEDRRFYEHHGVDGEAVVRAARSNLVAGRTVQGASTLTQQLVENLRLLSASSDQERWDAKAQTIQGKIIEAKTALELEEHMSKDEILETYLNVVYFGAGAYGAGAAAERFFGVSVADLTLEQAATIAGMVREPSGLDPFVNPQRAQKRRDVVLAAMLDVGYITKAQYDAAVATPLDVSGGRRPENGCATSTYPFYCAVVMSALKSDVRLGATQAQRDAALYRGHLSIHTALDPDVMASIDAAIARALTNDNRVGTSVVVVEVGTGRVVGFGQNRAWGDGEGRTEIPYATAKFQPGSTFKPVVLAAAFEQGFSARQTMTAPSGFKPDGFDYPDGGFDNNAGVNYGHLNAFEATRRSSNVWFTKLITRTGVAAAKEAAIAMGASSLRDAAVYSRSASFALGAWEVQPLEMASVYATIAAGGLACEPVFIVDIVDDATGTSLGTSGSTCEGVYSAQTATTMIEVMQEPFAKGGTADDFPLTGRVAVGKTGTTNSHGAAWFVGATPQYSTAVWLGDPRGGQKYPLYDVRAYGRTFKKVYGADISGPLWRDVMEGVHAGLPVASFDDVVPPGRAGQYIAVLAQAPNVAGMDVEAAAAMLVDLGFDVTVDTVTSARAPAHVVARVSVEGNSVVLVAGDGTNAAMLGATFAAGSQDDLGEESDPS